MDIIWKVKSCFIKKLEPEYDGFELQNWKTFGLPRTKANHDWQGGILAVIIILIAAWSIRILTQNIFFWDVMLPQCLLVGISGILVVADLLEFKIKETAILIFLGLLIIFF